MSLLAGNIRAVTFDVGNTLIEVWPSVGHVYAEVASAYGHTGFSPEELNRRFRTVLNAHGKAVNTKREWAHIVEESFAGLLSRPISNEIFPELYDRFVRASAWRIFDDVEPTISVLRKRGMKLGVISNWDDRLRPLLHALGLADQFDVIVISCEVGVSKPERAIFETAVQQLGVPAQDVLHVGDNFDMDVAGANAAGLHGVQVDRQATVLGEAQISSLLDLLKSE